ncbi:hypothetical protein NLG97_g7389 [Lecanicillium saksenae]|uniref:Uncharacterized protein n=1 Tax=Lecanicillium saksenae TaxID=468837 RepID=A0ACC1QLY0_9HYPO|nr:hypothetical protein NLG97_g7389 [Lecanicillium saksenae]
MRIHESKWGIAPRRLDDDVPPEVVRCLLTTAGRIERLAADCLRFYLARFHTLRPEHPMPSEPHVDHRYDYSNGGPQCQPARIKHLDGFQWEEEQRAVRALWRYQLSYELKSVVLGEKSLAWEDPDTLEATPAVEMPTGPAGPRRSFYGWRYDYRDDYLWDVLYDIGYREDSGCYWITHSPEYEEISSVAEFISARYGSDIGASYRNGSLCVTRLKCVADPISPFQPACKDWRKLVYAGAGLEFYFDHGPQRIGPPLPFYRTDFSHFAGFEFAFWSALRSHRFGLHGPGQRYPQPWGWWYHAWYSITPKQNITWHEKHQNVIGSASSSTYDAEQLSATSWDKYPRIRSSDLYR